MFYNYVNVFINLSSLTIKSKFVLPNNRPLAEMKEKSDLICRHYLRTF